MIELLRTNDPVVLSFATVVLADEGIEAVVLDQYTSIIEGSIGAVQRRLMVIDSDAAAARRLLGDAGIPLPDGQTA